MIIVVRDDILNQTIIQKEGYTLKKLRFAFYFLGIACMLSVPAFAYVDPSVTTFALQAVAAVVVAVAAVAGVMWRKAKKKAQQVLHIDENSNKTVEDEVVVFEEPAEEPAAAEAAVEEPAADVTVADEPVADAVEEAPAEEAEPEVPAE